MIEPEWLEDDFVLRAQTIQLGRNGGLPGVRDKGLLDSALSRPRNLFHYGGDVSLFDLAAAYAFGLARNHPFADGNKRIAFVASSTFLRINGLRLATSQADVVAMFLALAAGEIGESDLSDWFRRHCVPSEAAPVE